MADQREYGGPREKYAATTSAGNRIARLFAAYGAGVNSGCVALGGEGIGR
jgi:hypothetical protein